MGCRVLGFEGFRVSGFLDFWVFGFRVLGRLGVFKLWGVRGLWGLGTLTSNEV